MPLSVFDRLFVDLAESSRGDIEKTDLVESTLGDDGNDEDPTPGLPDAEEELLAGEPDRDFDSPLAASLPGDLSGVDGADNVLSVAPGVSDRRRMALGGDA
jgi:hypothetical protein